MQICMQNSVHDHDNDEKIFTLRDSKFEQFFACSTIEFHFKKRTF